MHQSNRTVTGNDTPVSGPETMTVRSYVQIARLLMERQAMSLSTADVGQACRPAEDPPRPAGATTPIMTVDFASNVSPGKWRMKGNPPMPTDTQQQRHARPHPTARRAPPALVGAMEELLGDLRDGPRPASAQHGREVLYEDAGLSVLLLLLAKPDRPGRPGAVGVVTMHVLRGSVELTLEDQIHELRSGQMLVLAPPGTEPRPLKVLFVDDVSCDAPERAHGPPTDDPGST